MFKHKIAVMAFVCLSLLLAACGSPITDSPSPDDPVSSDDPIVPTTAPTPIEGDVIEGLAVVTGMDILILESFPVQVNVRLDMEVGDTCTGIGEIEVKRENDTFVMTVPTLRPADALCAEQIIQLETFVSLDVLGLAAGEYTVEANGYTGTFRLDMDNEIQLPSDEGDGMGGGTMQSGLAGIESARVEPGGDGVTLIIRGWLADGCTELGGISENVDGQTITITVESLRDPDLMCAQVISEFETTYTIMTALDAGEYTVEINAMTSTSFTIE